MELERLDFELPEDLIAQRAVEPRDSARLMVVDRDSRQIVHRHFRDLPEYLRESDTLVANNTQVLPARLYGHRQRTGGKWEGLYLQQVSDRVGEFMCRTRGKPEAGERIVIEDGAWELELVEKTEDGHWRVRSCSDVSIVGILAESGRMPLPPYIRGGVGDPADRERYQTIYARHPGAIAAPTAGLHFTEELINRIAAQQIAFVELTLHVGAGTFQPIRDSLDKHQIHSEWAQIDPEAVDIIRTRRAAGGRTVTVGTTSVRVLETASTSGELVPFEGESRIFIRPPFEFQAVDVLVTNFHLPRSTLLALLYAFAGEDLIREAYRVAVQNRYRFFSYGDAMLVL